MATAISDRKGDMTDTALTLVRELSSPRRSEFRTAHRAVSIGALILRLTCVGLLAWAAAIHLHLWSGGYRMIPTDGPLFLADVIAGFVLAAIVLVWPSPLAAILGAGFMISTLVGLVLSINIGLFGFKEALGASFVVQSIVLESIGAAALLGLAGLEMRVPTRQRPQHPPSQHARLTRRPVGVLTSLVLLIAAAGGVAVAVRSSSAPKAASTQLGSMTAIASTTPPAGARKVTLSSGLGSIALPAGFVPVGGDPGTASFARLAPDGSYVGFLNVTPRQGDERLEGWAAFRLAHLRSEGSMSALEHGAVEGVPTAQDARSCLTDDYVTQIGHHHFQEIACLVMTGSTGDVVVAATPWGDPGHLWMQLGRDVASYSLA
jgi:hypothetical protein